MEPKNPIEAVTHKDPYPYYGRLLAGAPMDYDNQLGLWIACRADTVSEIFDSPACRVRPMSEPVPGAIRGLPAGEIFGSLVRMNDGAGHDQPKRALVRALSALPLAEVHARAQHVARLNMPAEVDTKGLARWMFGTPVAVVADLLGVADDERATIADWTREFVACLSPLSGPDELAAASTSASLLRSSMQSLLRSTRLQSGTLVARVRAQADAVGWADSTALIANLVGLLSQTYEATAGLIGNAIVALATHPHLIGEVRRTADGWAQLVHETSRYDAPVQNTRRFAAERTRIAGIDLESGSAILLVLAAANRDPNANACPEEFRIDRPDRRVLSFSRGAHACPGEALARAIAAAALAGLFETVSSGWLGRLTWSWAPSVNVRLPVFSIASQ